MVEFLLGRYRDAIYHTSEIIIYQQSHLIYMHINAAMIQICFIPVLAHIIKEIVFAFIVGTCFLFYNIFSIQDIYINIYIYFLGIYVWHFYSTV